MNTLTLKKERERIARFGWLAFMAFAGLVLVASFAISITSAVIAPGIVVTGQKNTTLQHVEGGKVQSVHVRNGEFVSAGTILVELETENKTLELNRLRELQLDLYARERRLKVALGEGSWSEPFGNKLRGRMGPRPREEQSIIQEQRQLLEAEQRRSSSEIQRAVAEQRAAELSYAQVQNQISINNRQIALIDQELPKLEELVSKNLVQSSQLIQMQRQRLDILQQIEALQSEAHGLNRAKASARDTARIVRLQLEENRRRELEETQIQLAEVTGQISQIDQSIERAIIKAPMDGYVHELNFQNAEAVIAPGEVVLQIVPANTPSVIEARVPAAEIDDLKPNSKIRVRFDTYRHLGQVELHGSLLSVSPDRSTDPQTGEVYYASTIAIDRNESAKFEQLSPVSGVPVTVLFETQKRSIASYLLEPVTKSFKTAFQET